MRRFVTGSLASLPNRVQRSTFKLFYLGVLVSFAMLAKPARAVMEPVQLQGSHPQIRLAPQGWGSTALPDLQLVLNAVADLIGSHFPQRSPITLSVVPGEDAPMALYDRNAAGEYVIQLSARHSRWHQFVYQFSHELCHVYSNFDGKSRTTGDIDHRNQWFEESVCEAVALHTLNELAEEWDARPPSAHLAGYGQTLRALSRYLRNEPHRRLEHGTTLAAWFSAHRAVLEADPYQRDMNEVVANRLLQVFEHAPDAIGAIGFLNLGEEDGAQAFLAYLTAWRDACPDRYRSTVTEIVALFDAAPAPLLAASAASLAQR